MSNKNQILVEYGAKWKEAVEKEQLIRDASFLNNTELVGGIEVYSLTPRLFITLTFQKNGFVTENSDVTIEDILGFLWVVAVNKPESKELFAQMVIEDYDLEKICKDIAEYFEWNFQDVSIGTGGSSSKAPRYSSTASLVHIIASEYGWSEKDILNTPYRRLFQYMRIINANSGGKVHFSNRSDEIKVEMMQKINEKD